MPEYASLPQRSGRAVKLLATTTCVLWTALAGCAARPSPDVEPTSTPTPALPSAADSPRDAAGEGPLIPAHPGCMLIADLASGAPIQLGEQDCGEAINPASTFKVPHALIALEAGVVSGPDDTVAWDGSEQYFKVWERDHTLRTAIYNSVVWYFQRTARAIGMSKMTEQLRAFDYGNADPSSAIDSFWLGGGSLKIDAFGQLRFMQRLYGVGEPLPVSAAHTALVRELLERPPSSFSGRILEGHSVPAADEHLVFAAKTGTARLGEGSVTWIVGHAHCDDRNDPGYVFVSRVAANTPLSIESPAVTHALEALGELKRLDC